MSELGGRAGAWRRLAWLAACGLAFIVVYGTCTAITKHRSGVGTWYHPLELEIPFVPWMIVPYWTSDLLFVGAFLLAPDRQRLDALGKRVLAAIGMAGLGFLLVPLQLAFPRPEVTGFPGALFALLRSFDGPHNLFPSLHVALGVVWTDIYLLRGAEVAGRVGRALAGAWLALVVASTLLTWQHHVVDLLGGAFLGLVCVHAFRPEDRRVVTPKAPQLGARYAAGALVAAGAAVATWPLGSVLLWPATALAFAAAGYLGRGPWIWRKQDGRKPLSTRLVMAPCLFGQWLSLVWYRRRCQAWDKITDRVWIGRVLHPREAQAALAAGVTAVLDLTAELDEAWPFLAWPLYRNVPVLDLTAPSDEQMRGALAFLDECVAADAVVYVHCKIGYSRTAAVVGAWLVASGRAQDADAAVAALRRSRPTIVIRPEARRSIERHERGAPAAPTPRAI